MSNAPSDERWWWSAAGDRYFDLAAGAPPASEPSSALTLLSLGGARRDLDAGALVGFEVGVERVLEGLLPELRAALERLKGAVASLDPAFDIGDPSHDVVVAAERVVRKLGAAKEEIEPSVRATITAIAEDAAVIMKMLAFGSISEHLVRALGLSPTGGATGESRFEWLGESESAAAMVTRVRAQVRDELEAHATRRPNRSFEFKDLIKPPTRDFRG